MGNLDCFKGVDVEAVLEPQIKAQMGGFRRMFRWLPAVYNPLEDIKLVISGVPADTVSLSTWQRTRCITEEAGHLVVEGFVFEQRQAISKALGMANWLNGLGYLHQSYRPSLSFVDFDPDPPKQKAEICDFRLSVGGAINSTKHLARLEDGVYTVTDSPFLPSGTNPKDLIAQMNALTKAEPPVFMQTRP